MAELLDLLQNLSPFVVLAGLGILYFQGKNKDSDAKIIAAQLEADTAKYRADAEARRELQEEKKLAARAVEDERRAKNDQQTALLMAQTTAALVTLAGTQKQTTKAVGSSEKRIVASGTADTEALSTAIREVMQAIIKLAGDQTIAMTTMQEFLQELSDKLNDTSASEVVIADVSPSAVNTIASAVAGNELPKASGQ
jgi:hypothetical protein